MDIPANQPETKIKKITQWLRVNFLTICTIFGCAFYYFQWTENVRLQQQIEKDAKETREFADRRFEGLRQLIVHSNETDFALRLSGMKQTATVTENAMIQQYQQNLERIAVAKQQGCRIPPRLADPIAIPNYVPIATMYLQEKQKLEKENY